MSIFPDPRDARHDVVAICESLETEILVDAYRHGIFPWPVDGMPLMWFSPRRRAVLDAERLHLSKSLAKERRRGRFTFTIDREFDAVIRHCAATPRPGQEGTWITREIVDAFGRLHRAGYAHSVEVWHEGALAGGLYGVDPGGAFGGESMFYLVPNASKLALVFLVEHLESKGLDWIDLQIMTPHMRALGARAIQRAEYLDRLAAALEAGRPLFP